MSGFQVAGTMTEAVVAVTSLAGEVRRWRLGQRERRERDRVGDADLRLLRSGAVGGFTKLSRLRVG